MAMATQDDHDDDASLHGFQPRGDRLPGGARREQRPGLVPAPQGRLRAPREAAARGALRRARGSVRGTRGYRSGAIRPGRRSGSIATPASRRTSRRTSRLRAPTSRGSMASATGPGGYFHLQPGEVYIGGGMWHPEPARLAAWRAMVADDPAAVHAGDRRPTASWPTFGDVHGDSLKRIPAGFPADHPDAELLKLKDVIFGRRLSDAEALSPTSRTPSPTRSPTPSRSSASWPASRAEPGRAPTRRA